MAQLLRKLSRCETCSKSWRVQSILNLIQLSQNWTKMMMDEDDDDDDDDGGWSMMMAMMLKSCSFSPPGPLDRCCCSSGIRDSWSLSKIDTGNTWHSRILTRIPSRMVWKKHSFKKWYLILDTMIFVPWMLSVAGFVLFPKRTNLYR